MDINTLRALLTTLAFASFVGIAWWAYSRRRQGRFAEAANLPFADDVSAAAAPHSKSERSPKESA